MERDEDYEYGEREYELPADRQRSLFEEWFQNSEHAELGDGGFKDALKEAWDASRSSSIRTFKDLLEQVTEDIDGL